MSRVGESQPTLKTEQVEKSSSVNSWFLAQQNRQKWENRDVDLVYVEYLNYRIFLNYKHLQVICVLALHISYRGTFYEKCFLFILLSIIKPF